MSKLKVLISNDDGYDATGIVELAAAMREIADVRICAPLTNKSGASSSLTLLETVTVSVDGERTIVHGTPTDCVHLALTAEGLLPWRPDLTVSGINAGANLGEDTMYSGTVAAAAESVLLGVPAIAFSLVNRPWRSFPPIHFKDAAAVARDLVLQVKDQLIGSGDAMLNVNIPDLPRGEVLEPVVCPLGWRYPEREIDALDSEDSELYRFGHVLADSDGHANSDYKVVENSHVSVTPLHFNLTDHANLATVESWLEEN